MAKRLTSPTAQLLRNSRLFSLPPPIAEAGNVPGTSSDYTSVSDTATRPFPIRQAIVTPPSSLYRGDWGLKRPLPLRETTRSSAPTMRVHEVDNINLFTDFESAGDHVRTLEKWQEMNIPLTSRPDARKLASGVEARGATVFDERSDNTQLVDGAEAKGHTKWKFEGRWITGMTEGEFKRYLETQIRWQKKAFKRHMKKYFFEKAFMRAWHSAREHGDEVLPDRKTFRFSNEDYEQAVKALREDTTLSSELSRMIGDFFDIPGIHTEGLSERTSTDSPLERMGTTAIKGPPSTHPSAGLSYLRSSAFLHNHPILGPQDAKEPIEARLLSGSQTTQRVTRQRRAGVGGVVADLKVALTAKTDDAYSIMRYEVDGGPKVWVTPERAYIDSNGRIKLDVAPAFPEAVRIKQGSLKSKEEEEAGSAPKIDELDTRAVEFGAANAENVREQGQQILGALKQMLSEEPRASAPRRRMD